MSCVNVLIYYQYYHIHSLVFINLQINRHSYFNLISRDIYLGLRVVVPYDTFSICNLTPGFGFGFQIHIFPNKESFLEFYFIFYFPLKK